MRPDRVWRIGHQQGGAFVRAGRAHREQLLPAPGRRSAPHRQGFALTQDDVLRRDVIMTPDVLGNGGLRGRIEPLWHRLLQLLRPLNSNVYNPMPKPV